MKNNKLVNFFKKSFKHDLSYKDDLFFIANLFAFMTLLKTSAEELEINEFIKASNLGENDIKKLKSLLNNPDDHTMVNELSNYVLTIFKIKHDLDIYKKIIDLFCQIYLLHSKTKKINYFYEKNYFAEDDDKSIGEYMLITQWLGELNNNIKLLLIKDYDQHIKMAKDFFLKVKLYE